MSTYTIDMSSKVRPTRFPKLGYVQLERQCWRFVDLTDGASPVRVVGPQYKTKTEMMADLGRYAREAWGLG